VSEAALACDKSRPVAEFIWANAGSQCGQWCVFQTRNPNNNGIVYNGRCWEWFDLSHGCHQYGNLKARAGAA